MNIFIKVGLEQVVCKKVKYFLLGMKQCLGFVYFFFYNFELLILDELMNGLDFKGMKELCIIFFDLVQQGVFILILIYLLLEMEEICDRVVYIKKGWILGIEEMKKRNDFVQKKLFIVMVNNFERVREILEQEGIF